MLRCSLLIHQKIEYPEKFPVTTRKLFFLIFKDTIFQNTNNNNKKIILQLHLLYLLGLVITIRDHCSRYFIYT